MASDFLREIAGPSGPLEALLDLPEGEPRAVAVFGHPHPLHGGTMHTKALYQAAKAMPRIGVAALRINFRGVGRSAGTFDAGAGEKDDFRAAITFAQERFPDVPVWAAGMSFGSWIAMTTGAEDARVSLLLATGGTYNRVEGLPIVLGPVFDLRVARGTRLKIDALGMFRTGGQAAGEGADLGFMVRGELRRGEVTGFGVGVRAYDAVTPIEDWTLHANEVGWATFLFHRDYRDYYHKLGYAFRLFAQPARPLVLGVQRQRPPQLPLGLRVVAQLPVHAPEGGPGGRLL